MKVIFPIIIFDSKDSIVYFYLEYNRMRKTSEEHLDKGIWDDSTIIDSKGKLFTIKQVNKTGLRGIFGWHPLLKGKSIWVDFVFSNGTNVDIDNLKLELIERVEKSKFFWELAWNIRDLKNAIKNAIKNAKTFEELIVLFR